jgi:NADH:ubiquinone oxidoreductase subunit E
MSEPSLEERLARLAASYPSAQMALLPVLRYLVREGAVPGTAVGVAARVCQVDEEAVRSLLAAYPALRGAGRRTAVCGGLTCFLQGAWRILAQPEAFGLTAGGFDRTPCLGYCFAAPILQSADGTVCHVEVPRAARSVEIGVVPAASIGQDSSR